MTDIRVKEPTLESLTKKKREYQPPHFMTVNEATDQLLQILDKKLQSGVAEKDLAYTALNLCVGVARVGHETQKILVCPLKDMLFADLGGPLHSMVLPAKNLHELELLYMQQFSKEKLI